MNRLRDPRRWWVLGVLCLVIGMVVTDNTILSVAIPQIRHQLGTNETGLQWISATYGLVLAGLLLPLAVLGDRWGRRRLLVCGLAVFAIGSALAVTAGSATLLIVARGVMGAGGACAMPATLAILSDVFDDAERGMAIVIWSAAAGLAAAAGPLVGGGLLEHFWWGSVFLANVPVVALALVGTALLVPASCGEGAPPVDLTGAVLWWGALTALLLAIIEGPPRGWSALPVVAGFIGTVVLLVGFVARQRRATAPLLDPTMVRRRAFRVGVTTVTATFFAMFGAQFVLTQWLQGPQHSSPLTAGACFAPAAIASVIAPFAVPRLSERWGFGGVAMIGMSVMGIGCIATGLIVLTNTSPVVAATLTIVALGLGLAAPAGVELIMSSAPPERAGSGSGVNETMVEAAGAIGVAVLGSVLSASRSFVIPLPVAAGVLFAATAASAAPLRRRTASTASPRQPRQLVELADD